MYFWFFFVFLLFFVCIFPFFIFVRMLYLCALRNFHIRMEYFFLLIFLHFSSPSYSFFSACIFFPYLLIFILNAPDRSSLFFLVLFCCTLPRSSDHKQNSFAPSLLPLLLTNKMEKEREREGKELESNFLFLSTILCMQMSENCIPGVRRRFSYFSLLTLISVSLSSFSPSLFFVSLSLSFLSVSLLWE